MCDFVCNILPVTFSDFTNRSWLSDFSLHLQKHHMSKSKTVEVQVYFNRTVAVSFFYKIQRNENVNMIKDKN